MAGLIGKTIGNYELVERLGRGAMAVVYKAYQKPLKRFVAIKILHPEVANDETFLARFQREARSVAALRHPNIVQVHDFGTEAGFFYLVMEYVEGPSLKQRLETLRQAGQTMPHHEVRHVIRGVASALDHAHTHGIIHRDVKPGNVVLTAPTGGDAILTDFGLTRMLGVVSLTGSGILGTPEYLSPEQADGKTIDARSDVYALGVVLYEMLTGQTPFEGETPINMILKHVQGEIPPPREVYPDLSAELEGVLMRALAHAPDDRYQRAGEMADALALAIPSLPTVPAQTPAHLSPSPPAPETPAQRPRRPRGRLQPISRQALRRAANAPSGLAPELCLLVVRGARAGQSIPLVGRITLGRAPTNTLDLDDARTSRQHVMVEAREGRVRLTDLNSTNGTLVNGQRVSTVYLREGDSVQIGDVMLLVQRRKA